MVDLRNLLYSFALIDQPIRVKNKLKIKLIRPDGLMEKARNKSKFLW